MGRVEGDAPIRAHYSCSLKLGLKAAYRNTHSATASSTFDLYFYDP